MPKKRYETQMISAKLDKTIVARLKSYAEKNAICRGNMTTALMLILDRNLPEQEPENRNQA